MSPSWRIKSRMRAVRSWIMLYYGRATGNQHLESKGMADRAGNDPGRRSEKSKRMFKR